MFNKITLNLQEKSYEIIVGSNILEQLKAFLQTKNYNKIRYAHKKYPPCTDAMTLPIKAE